MTTTLEKTNMDEFERLLEESFSTTNAVADIVEGTVIKKEQDILINISHLHSLNPE